MKLNGL